MLTKPLPEPYLLTLFTRCKVRIFSEAVITGYWLLKLQMFRCWQG